MLTLERMYRNRVQLRCRLVCSTVHLVTSTMCCYRRLISSSLSSIELMSPFCLLVDRCRCLFKIETLRTRWTIKPMILISMIFSKLSRTRSMPLPSKVRRMFSIRSTAFIVSIRDFFQVEQRKEDSRQRWQRTKLDVKEQKLLLKRQLKQRIHLWSNNLKKPNFIRTRDKISFTIGVGNACFSPLIGKKESKHGSMCRAKRDLSSVYSKPMGTHLAIGLHNSSTSAHFCSIRHL
jgi:hypothetical protein